MPYKNHADQLAATRRHYQENKAYYKAKCSRNTPITRQYSKDYLSKHPCVDCGEDDIIVLEYDHVRGKKRSTLSRMIQNNCSLATVKKEIAKCDVRCANCHRRKTAKEWGYS